MKFIKKLNSKFKGQIIYISNNKVINYHIGSFTMLAAITILLLFLIFSFYLLGFRVSSSAFLNKKELELKKMKSINLLLAKKLDIATKDIDLFNDFLYNSQQGSLDEINSTISPICNLGQNNIYIDNIISRNLQNNIISQNNTFSSSKSNNHLLNQVSYFAFDNSNGIDNKMNLLKAIINLDLKLLMAKQLINIDMQNKIKAVSILDSDGIDKQAIYNEIRGEDIVIKRKYQEVISKTNAINDIENEFETSNILTNVADYEIADSMFEDESSNIERQIKNCNAFECVSENPTLRKLLILNNLRDKLLSLPIGKPINFIRVTSSFGGRIDPKSKAPSFHHGIDIVGNKNEKIVSVSDGIVVAAGQFSGYGNYIEISHGNNIRTGYAHLKKILVKAGDKINKGDIIGIQGSTGKSTGDHLHYEIKIKNNRKDPIIFINNKNSIDI